MRSIYENQSDRDNEQAVADLISREKNLMLVKLAHERPVGLCGVRGDDVRCFIEVRCRNVASTKYSDIMVIGTRQCLPDRSCKHSTCRATFLCNGQTGLIHQIR